MKKYISILSATAAAVVMSVQLASAELKVGFAAENYPPFTEKGADGKWVGWEVEIKDALCAAMNEECTVVEIAWDGIIPALLSKLSQLQKRLGPIDHLMPCLLLDYQ